MTEKVNPIPKAVLWLREQDHKLGKHVRSCKFKTPWDVDWISIKCRDNKDLLSYEINGRSISITASKQKRIGKEILVYVQDLLILQFCNPSDLEKILKAYEVFGTCVLTKYPDKSLDKVIDYCNKADDCIVDMVNKLTQAGMKNIFDQIVREMGGDSIRHDDKIGQRVLYYKEIVDRYKKDNSSYLQDMRNLKLLV
jgi:hypothetical protein